MITIASPSANGQNALIHGAVSGSAKCDDGLVLLIDSEADCPGVGDTIDFTYTLINFEDYYIDYLGGTSMLFGSLDFGTDTILANSQLVKDTFYIVTESDLPGPVFDSLRYAGYNFFENGVKPIWDIGKESASLFEVDFSMTASTDSVLIGETVVFDYFIKN